jgi:hypothetical protein
MRLMIISSILKQSMLSDSLLEVLRLSSNIGSNH